MLNHLTNQSTVLLVLFAAGISTQALAFDTDQVQQNQTAYAEQFKQLDANHNDLLIWPEAKKDSVLSEADFTGADKNHDGALNQQEYAEIKSEISKKKVSQVVSDSVITTKAKAKLLAEESLKSLKISVETYKGEVLLSGFVNSADTKAKAEALVATIEGVKSVKNSLVIKS